MKKIQIPFIILLLLAITLTLTGFETLKEFADGNRLNPPALTFRPDGKFVIMQMTDFHWMQHRENMWELLERSIEAVRPDLIILTGDIVTDSDTRRGWEKVTAPLVRSGIPWAVVFGNHDTEHDLTKPEIIRILSRMPGNLTVNGPDDVSGNGNYALTVASPRTGKTASVLYCFDTRRQEHGLDSTHIRWYAQQSRAWTAANNGKPLPSLAFFHIPVPEYSLIAGKPSTLGAFGEPVCCPPHNAGALAAFAEQGDVMGTFTGHDHRNNFIGSHSGIALAYGYNTSLSHDSYYKIGRGVRVIELTEGARTFATWLVKVCDEPAPGKPFTFRSEVEILNRKVYPDDFPPAVDAPQPPLTFRPDGKFVIMQMTDIHWTKHRKRMWNMFKLALDTVRPDLILLTGDIVTGPDTRSGWQEITAPLVECGIPWAVTFGNHDTEHELTKPEILRFLSDLPGNLTVNGPDNISGNGNYLLEIASSQTPGKTAAALYCFDSRQQDNWIDFTQINWYRQQSDRLKASGAGAPLPSLAFFHIPIPEYKLITGKPTTVGTFGEPVCDPPLNSGLLAAFVEQGDVMGTFVGHDHHNNYIGVHHNVALAYGYATTLADTGFYCGVGRGVRVIELTEGARTFATWLVKTCDEPAGRQRWTVRKTAAIMNRVVYPDDFAEK
jgi:predicted MPP superfamily phosphohydrolase